MPREIVTIPIHELLERLEKMTTISSEVHMATILAGAFCEYIRYLRDFSATRFKRSVISSKEFFSGWVDMIYLLSEGLLSDIPSSTWSCGFIDRTVKRLGVPREVTAELRALVVEIATLVGETSFSNQVKADYCSRLSLERVLFR